MMMNTLISKIMSRTMGNIICMVLTSKVAVYSRNKWLLYLRQ